MVRCRRRGLELGFRVRSVRRGVALGVAGLLLVLIGGFEASAQDGLSSLSREVEAMRTDWGIPGVSVAVVVDGEIAFAEGFGVRELGGSDPVDANTVFAVGSTSKAFTAAAIATLVDDGLLRWDDPVIDHLPDFRLSDPFVTRELRVRDLMSHNSGLLRGDRIWYASGRSRDQVLHRVRHQPISFSLRSTFQYNNIMWLAAGEIVEELTGLTWDDVLAQRIFTPLGMDRTTTSVAALSEITNVATPHIELEDVLVSVPYRDVDNIGPAGSINSSAIEMAHWVRMHLAEGSVGGQDLISPSGVEEMRTAQIVVPLEGAWGALFPGSNFLEYGLGWFLSDYRGLKVASHGGNIDGMTALVAMVPEREYGVVVLANRASLNDFTMVVANRVMDLLEGGERHDWSDEIREGWSALLAETDRQQEERLAARVDGTSPSLPVEAYVGTYRSDMYGDMVVTLEGDRLQATFGPHYSGPLEHWHYDTFRVLWDDPSGVKEFLSFVLGADGNPSILNAEIEGPVEFERVEVGQGGS